MPGNNLPPSILDDIEDLRGRLAKLERQNTLQRASANDGEVTRLEFGEITHPYSNPVGEPDFGLIVRADNTPGSDNAVVFMADSGGALIPGDKGFIQAAAGGSTNATPSDTHTSTSWVESWSSWFVGRLGEVVSIQMLIAAGVGITSAEARLRTTGLNGGDATSDAISLTANGGLVQYTWHWNPGGSINPNDVWGLLIDTRITGGSGTMTVVEPRWTVQRSAVAVDTNVTGV